MSTLKFAPVHTVIDVEFWSRLSDQILTHNYLNHTQHNIYAQYVIPNNKHTHSSTQLSLNNSSFSTPTDVHSNLICCGTNEQFQSYNTIQLIDSYKHQLWNALCHKDIEIIYKLITEFYIVNYSDLKLHQHHYIVCVPQLVLPSDTVQFNITNTQSIDTYITNNKNLAAVTTQIQHLFYDAHSRSPYFLIVKHSLTGQYGYNTLGQTEYYTVHPFNEYNNVIQNNDMKYNKLIFGCIDTINDSTQHTHLLRNLFVFIGVTAQYLDAEILLFRDFDAQSNNHSAVLTLSVQTNNVEHLRSIVLDSIRVVGWERNKFNKIAPRQVDLGRLMDPLKLAESSINLNLQLMKWRVLPDVRLDCIQSCKYLLLGAGTLGCNVARCLLAWGIINITLVDNGKVSYSNPVRQSLFTYNDCLNGGKYKSVAAADALKLIYPNINANGVVMTIPMAGHTPSSIEIQSTNDSITQLIELINSHDVIFLLTDSRESRWLPTVLCKSMHKLCINTALGFDTFVVMRHGNIPPANSETTINPSDIELGCYFCNDVIAPVNSLRDRTLDQQCTVTRPGLSYIASSESVELCVATLHHPLQQYAPAINTECEPLMCGFGTLPHQIRGFLNRFEQKLVIGHAFKHCVACSENILNQYKTRGHAFIMDALNQSSEYLETLSGLTGMKQKTDDLLAQAHMQLDGEDEQDDW